MSAPVQKPPAPPESSGPPLRALAMVLISLAIVFAALGLFSLTGSDSEETAPAAASVATTSAAAAPPATSAASAPTSSAATSSGAATTSGSASSTSVRVLNNSNTAGLAARTAETLEQAGFTIGETGNYSDGTISQTTVFYDSTVPGQQDQAEKIATALGAESQPRFAGIENAAPGIIVIVTE